MTDKKIYRLLTAAAVLLALFSVLIAAVLLIDVAPIGPNGSEIGLSTVNAAVFKAFGINMILYDITDWLGFVPLLTALCFAVLGLCQLISRKSLKKVDFDIIALGVFYIAVFAAYIFFEKLVVNYRPVLIDGVLEASFPSSHTMLACTIMGTAMYRLWNRIPMRKLRIFTVSVCGAVILITVAGRLISGVHWFTDIIGGLLLSGALILIYIAVCGRKAGRNA